MLQILSSDVCCTPDLNCTLASSHSKWRWHALIRNRRQTVNKVYFKKALLTLISGCLMCRPSWNEKLWPNTNTSMHSYKYLLRMQNIAENIRSSNVVETTSYKQVAFSSAKYSTDQYIYSTYTIINQTVTFIATVLSICYF